ncbi:cytochrome c biogenesis protein ResB [Aeromicrobium sp. CTD01-1L150]|uniref:cytochrome c biogenesis protein ResB n=1 Tax=Aeromicrobium sp. CTD01-1L150 TaxID=3341830 RepID=UPI0035C0F978
MPQRSDKTETGGSRGTAPALGRTELMRWVWRQLTSMRTALILLMLLAIAAVPGSVVPQRGVDARAVEAYFSRNPDLAPWLDRFGFFAVYTSPWFSAIYLLLMVSLIGCIVPRTGVYLRALRARPPKAPKRLERLPAFGTFETDASPAEVSAAARSVLAGPRVLPSRIDVVDGGAGGDVDGADASEARSEVRSEARSEVRVEKGYLRELGNLIFHVSIVAVLVGVAVGALFGYRGAAIVTQGDSFANVLTQYDEFSSGALFDPDDLPPFSLQLDQMEARFWTDGPQRGAPRLFRARGTYEERPGAEARDFDVQVNSPLAIDGTSVFLVGQGYAPVLRVTDAEGDVVFDDAVPFLPQDGTYTSNGVVQVPDAQPQQLGFQGFFLPTAVTTGEEDASISAFPGAVNPLVGLFVFEGDLGLDDGTPQSVYILDKTNLTQLKDPDGENFRVSLSPGQTADLPNGGSIEFVDLVLFARFQVASTPLVQLPLVAISIGIVGLVLSLLVRPRRTWVRSRREGSRTVVEVAALDRVPRDDLPDDLDDLLDRLRVALGVEPDDAGPGPNSTEPNSSGQEKDRT